jgi:hypothetical protein
MVPMTHKKLSSVASRLLLFALVPALVATASAEWKEKVLYSFQDGTDGQLPVGSIVFDSAGNLYGATTQGGATNCSPLADCGTVFQLTPPAKEGDPWTETVLYTFKGAKYSDGDEPAGGLLIDSHGNLYGTTAYGGTGDCVLLGVKGGCGTLFELSPPSEKGGAWTETILYSFPTAKQGYLPNGDLVFDSAGNLYGATEYGGGKGTNCDGFYQYCGAVFELSPPKTKGGKWTERVLHAFKGVASGAQFGDGANPNGGLVLDSKGAIYGTTYFGGNNVKGECEGGVGGTGCGIVFELTPPSQKSKKWTEKVLHQFDGQDGSNSAAGVVFDGIGNLYGTTSFGPGPYGLAFELKKPSGNAHSWTETVLHAFSDGSDGASPMAGLVLDVHGTLCGTTAVATNRNAQGTIFQLKPPTQKGKPWVFAADYTFQGPPDGAYPAARLIIGKGGTLFGSTQLGGTGQGCGTGNCGTVFEAKP